MKNAPAILFTFIKLPFVIKIFVLSIFEWPLKTDFTVTVLSGWYNMAIKTILSQDYLKRWESSVSKSITSRKMEVTSLNIPDKKRNAPLRTVQLPGRSQGIQLFSLYQCKGMSSIAASHVFCNLAPKLC